jgi:hypothetical protein
MGSEMLKLNLTVCSTESSLDKSKATFDSSVSTLRWLGTNGLRFLLQAWYTKQPIFWIPQGWVPYYAEWLLSFPRAPLGSISIQAWCVACAAVILLVSDALVAIFGLIMGAKTGAQPQKNKEEPMKFSAGEKPAGAAESKKEF